jgi:hypothetical protein
MALPEGLHMKSVGGVEWRLLVCPSELEVFR